MKEQNIYIGNCSKNGIYHYKLKKNKLVKQEYEKKNFERCTYLAKNESFLYSTIEKKDGRIVSYKLENGQIRYVNEESAYGQGPCHIELDEKNKCLFVSNYGNGYLSILKINEDGSIGKKIYSNVENEQKSHVHCVSISKDNKFFFVTDLGENIIIAYEIEDDEVNEISRVKLKEGTEPRHIAIGKKDLYVITEKSCEMYVLKFIDKKIYIKDVISLLPKDTKLKENYTGCAIKITKNFKYIYTTIRGHNSISVYKLNKNKLKMIQNINCEGDLPRDIELDKKEKYILVANQDSNRVVVFKRNRITGKIKYSSKEDMDSPTCVISK